MSPRKSSTSSGRTKPPRPRYLGLEVAGEHLPPLSPRAWEGYLRHAAESDPVPFKLIRSEGNRAVVEVGHVFAARARRAWNTSIVGDAGGARLTTRRTWGTLVGAKAWLRDGDRREGAGRRDGPQRD